MTAGAHEAGGGFGKSAGVNAARGFAVVAIAVVIGVLLMVKGLDKTDSVVAGETTDTTQPAGEDVGTDVGGAGDVVAGDGDNADTDPDEAVVEGTDDGTTTADTVQEEVVVEGPRAPADVTVLVLNGSGGLKGVAGRGTEKIGAAGYTTATAADARSAGPTLILYVEGYEQDAIAVAAVFGVEGHIEAFNAETSPVDDTQNAHVIVRIGNDNLITN